MLHQTIRQKLFALYDGPLTEKERKLVEGHLAQCRECRKAIAEWKALSTRLFPTRAFSEASEDFFTAKVMDRIRTGRIQPEKASWNLALRWLVPLLGSAAVAAWVFFAVLPDSSDLSSGANVQTAFTYDSSSGSGGNGIRQVSYSPDEIVP